MYVFFWGICVKLVIRFNTYYVVIECRDEFVVVELFDYYWVIVMVLFGEFTEVNEILSLIG